MIMTGILVRPASMAARVWRCSIRTCMVVPLPDVRKSVLEATDADSTYRLVSVVY